MAKDWYYANEFDENVGPIDAQRVRELVRRGTIEPSTMIWRDGLPDWVEARQIRKLWKDHPGDTSSESSSRVTFEPSSDRSAEDPYSDESNDDFFSLSASDLEAAEQLPPVATASNNENAARVERRRSGRALRPSVKKPDFLRTPDTGRPVGILSRCTVFIFDCFVSGFTVGTLFAFLSAASKAVAEAVWGKPIVEVVHPLVLAGAVYLTLMSILACFEASPWRGTPGKRLLGVMLVDMYDDQLTFLHSLARQIGRVITVAGPPIAMAFLQVGAEARPRTSGFLAAAIAFSGIIANLTSMALTEEQQTIYDRLVGVKLVYR